MLANCNKSEYNILMTHAVPYIPYPIQSVSLATQLGTCAKFIPKHKATMLSCMDQELLWSNGHVSLARRWGWCAFAASDDINVPVQNMVWPSETSYRHPYNLV